MSITDELRTGGIYRFPSNRRVFTEEELTAIADRIDAEHESACAEAYGNGVMSVPIALDESAWVELPKDANGEYIRIGDVMENVIHPPTHREVTGVGVECFYAWEDGCGRYSQFDAKCYRHHHKPTVEDVLRDMLDKWGEMPSNMTNEAIVTEYAAKLRLAGDAE